MSISNTFFTHNIKSESKTKNGVIFYPNKDIWQITDTNKKIKIDFIILHICNDNLNDLKNVFKWYLENNSIRHTENMYKYLKDLLNYLFNSSKQKIINITAANLINYRNSLNQNHKSYLGGLSGFLKKIYEMGYPLLTKDAYDYLKGIKLKGNMKGEAVLTMDPIKGPFTDIELESIQTAINNNYAEGNISTEDYILVWLFMIYGSRPIQFAQLKIKDIISITNDNGAIEIFINIPRVKNRKSARSEFKRRIVPPSFTQILYSFSKEMKNHFKSLLNNPEEAPLFSNDNLFEQKSIKNEEFQFHLLSSDITQRLKNIFKPLNVISERTGNKIHINALRFRRTIGTRAAVEGHGALIIAEILDHTDIQNVMAYIQSRPEIIKRIDKAVAIHMAPIAQAFAGTLVPDKSKAIRADDGNADIIDPNIDPSCTPTGKCGSYSFCGLMSPLACYTCSSFQAWVDGPHEAVLDFLLKERERLKKTTDHHIASINDRTIYAVTQVVLACWEYENKDKVRVIT